MPYGWDIASSQAGTKKVLIPLAAGLGKFHPFLDFYTGQKN